MGKHERGYTRVERDHYPTPAWVTEELLKHFDVGGMTVWEPAAGNGEMATVLKRVAKTVCCTDIAHRDFELYGVLDFTQAERPPSRRPPFAIITNPPFGPRGRLAEDFIRAGISHIKRGVSFLALLLPVDFDSAATRYDLFGGCNHFLGKIVLTRRIVWFQRTDGKKEAPKENHAWFLWQQGGRPDPQPALLYQRPDNLTG